MHKILPFAALLLLTLSATAQDANRKRNPYEIINIQTCNKRVGWVDNAWKDFLPCIQAGLRVTQDMGNEKPYVKAYFYDRDNKLVQKDDVPPQVSENYATYVGMPAFFKPMQEQKVFFPISAKATQPNTRWMHVVIVFGDGSSAAAVAYPKADLVPFDFGEKELALKGAAAMH